MSAIKQNSRGYFITAIGTDCGKTVVSAIFCKAFGYDYWKPVQSGLVSKDRDIVKNLVGLDLIVHPSRFELNEPMSPHAAAALDQVSIRVSDFELPTLSSLIVEGAGGIMVPLNEKELMLDLIKKLDLEVVLVSNIYLGSINHTLMTIEILKRSGVKIAGLVFNGEVVPSTIEYITTFSDLPILLQIPQLEEISENQIQFLANKLKESYA